MPERRTPLERFLRKPLPGMDHPVHATFTPDGSGLTFLQAPSGSNVRSLWRLETASGERQLMAEATAAVVGEAALTREEELERQRRRETGLGITRYRVSERVDLVVALASGTCLVARDGETARPLGGWDGIQDAIPAPDGDRIAVVAAGDLWIANLDGRRTRLTATGEPGRFNGLAEYAASEELDRFDGCWWSADGSALAWASVDERTIPEVVIGSSEADGGEPELHRYPFAGGPNAMVTLMVTALEPDGVEPSTLEVPLEIGDGYLARVVSHPGGGWLASVLPREQRSLRWWRVSPNGMADELWEERADPWLNLDDATRVLADGRILRTTESTGFRHLEMRAADGTLERRLTGGPWVVTALAQVDERRGEALVVGTADGTRERHCYAVPLDATRPVERPRRLTEEPGWHDVVFSRDGSCWVDTWSSRRTSPAVLVRSRDATSPLVVHAPSVTAEGLGAIVPELVPVTAADDRTPLEAAVFVPPRPAAAPPPAVVWVYGGPHAQYVRESWELTMHPLRQALAAAGFLVAMVDGRGSAHRGLAFEAPLAGAFGTVEVDDQVALVETLAAQGRLDPSRVGITGWSYGGYMVIRAMTRRPDVFRAGAAGAPVVSWTAYDTAYTERYLGDPATHPDVYTHASLPAEAERIGPNLLVIHGTLDENVHRGHTERLLEAVRASAGTCEVLWLPGERHLPQSRDSGVSRDRRVIAHLCRSLGVPVPADVAEAAQAAS